MSRLLVLLVLLLAPTSVSAAPVPARFEVARSLLAASSSPGNAYLAGISVVSTAPVAGDLTAFGGSIVAAAPVAGDGLLVAGSTRVRAPVIGDLRAIGATVNIEQPIGGDVAAVGYEVYDSGRPGGTVLVVAANATLAAGAAGPVTVYGNTISLAGDFGSDVTVVSTGRLTLSASTTIRGSLAYEAPEPATIPPSVSVIGGVRYTNASYLPDVGTSRMLAFLSVGFFLFARILGALILAGLLAGLFPHLAEKVSERAYRGRPRDLLLSMLLGFGILVAAPVLIVLLALTFVGIGLSFLLLILYALLLVLSFLYAGILVGSLAVRRFRRREHVLWHDGILGMLALSLVSLIPVVGPLLVLLLGLFTAGTLLLLFFQFAFSRDERADESV